MKSRVLTIETIIKNLEANSAAAAGRMAKKKAAYDEAKGELDKINAALAKLRGQAPEPPIEAAPSEAAI